MPISPDNNGQYDSQPDPTECDGFRMPERLETVRLILQKPQLSDAEAIFEHYATDPDVTRYMTWKPHRRVEETRKFLHMLLDRWRQGHGYAWCIVIKSTGTLAGMIDLRVQSYRCEFGYVLAKPHWGQGYMSEALLATRDLAFSTLPVQRCQIVCDIDNAASARVMEKAGFALEGILRRFMVHPNHSEVPRDVLCYSYVRPGL